MIEQLPFGQYREILDGGETWRWKNFSKMSSTDLRKWNAVSPYFSPEEIASADGELIVYVPALQGYNALRALWLKPHSPNSAYRSPAHNRDIGGAKGSRHMAGAAFDVPRRAMKLDEPSFIAAAKAHGFNGFGTYRTFIHIDMRSRGARWRGD